MSDFKLTSIVDSQLEDITSEITLPVITGAQSNNFQTFNSQSSTATTQIQFNIQIPSLSTAVSRHFLVGSDIVLKIDFEGGTSSGYWEPYETLFQYGKLNAMQAFPLNSLCSTVQSNLNNSTVSVNTRDVMAPLLKMYNYEELAKYNSLTPSLIDSFYQDYTQGIGSNNNVIGSYNIGSFSKEYQPRGTFPATLYSDPGLTNEIPLQVNASPSGGSLYSSVYLKIHTTEPLLFLSPFISGNSNNQASFLGINNLTLTMTLGSADRVMSNASYAKVSGSDIADTQTISNVSLVSVNNSKLLLNFFTIPPQLYAKIEPKNVVNYNQYSSYNYSTATTLAKGQASTFSFNNVQLNQIPSKILIFARPSQFTTYDSNYFACIQKVSINFCNKSGLLSSAQPEQLYNMSVQNGLQQNYYEFSGQGISNDTDGIPVKVPTIGSILCIDPAIDLSIDSQYSNMSGGQYNMQFDVTLYNQTASSFVPTLYLVVVNSGIFITENGVSSFTTGLLNQEMVLQTKSQEAVMDKHTYEKDIVGGSIENLNSIHKHLKLRFSRASEKEHQMDSEPGQSVSQIGSGMAAAGIGMPTRRKLHKYT